LTDVDLDCQDAIGMALEFLPQTKSVFGRKSKPCSHQFYITDLYQSEKTAVLKYARGPGSGQVLVELRTGGGGKGAHTTVPPSMHSAGELVQWVNDSEPTRQR
jgi:hypothetical protein